MKTLKLPEPLARARDQVNQQWGALPLRQRMLATTAGGVIGFALVWSLAVQPALTTLKSAPREIAQVDADLQQMQRLAAEARELRAAPPLSGAQSVAALRAATEQLGSSAKLTLVGDRATVTLTGADAGTVTLWLNEVRAGARARVIEAQLSRSGSGYTGSIVLAVRASN
ncbi:MAG TPA: type II secretion system protein GspM [Burkholderiaceae bacterium]|nr:type II secretion system protein GspM [Burkholderiaceae bacterium]